MEVVYGLTQDAIYITTYFICGILGKKDKEKKPEICSGDSNTEHNYRDQDLVPLISKLFGARMFEKKVERKQNGSPT